MTTDSHSHDFQFWTKKSWFLFSLRRRHSWVLIIKYSVCLFHGFRIWLTTEHNISNPFDSRISPGDFCSESRFEFIAVRSPHVFLAPPPVGAFLRFQGSSSSLCHLRAQYTTGWPLPRFTHLHSLVYQHTSTQPLIDFFTHAHTHSWPRRFGFCVWCFDGFCSATGNVAVRARLEKIPQYMIAFRHARI